MLFTLNRLLVAVALAASALPVQGPMVGSGPRDVLAADVQLGNTQALRSKAEQLFAMDNQERKARGLQPLEWDPALAAAAMKHCALMAAQGPISHQYDGEPDLDVRAGQAGAHFNLIAENVAMGYEPVSIHNAWMNSEGHRANLLNAMVNRAGVAVVARGDALYVVVDFSRGVQMLTAEQVEARVSGMVEATGVAAHGSSPGAREACAQDHGLPVSLDNRRPEFIMRWTDTELKRLPGALVDRISTGRYHDAAVGSCPTENPSSAYTTYRVAVLLLRPEPNGARSYISAK